MDNTCSKNDFVFKDSFESCLIDPSGFDHRAHLRLAYIYLCENDSDSAAQKMRDSLLMFLRHNKVDPSKYHETLTKAWILAVQHFMHKTNRSTSAGDFISQNPEMMDARIMLSHYSAEVLFSDEARTKFVQPDLDPIPLHHE